MRVVSTPRCSPRSRPRRPSGRVSTCADRRLSSRRWPGRSWRSGTIPSRSRPNASDRRDGEMDELMLDGTAIAGLLQEVFAVEMTTAIGTCGGCGAAGPVGAAHVYRGAGIVLRCPHCNNVLAKIVKNDSRVWIDFPGLRPLEVAV